MSKCSLVSNCLHLPVSTVGFYLLCLVAFVNLVIPHGQYNYNHLPRDVIIRELLTEVNPKIVWKRTLPICEYEEILKNNKTLLAWKIPKVFDDFSVSGIVNGSFTPNHCRPQISVAILITYRNRQSQLDKLLPYLHNFLRKQNIHYRVYLIEQQDEKPWNKGLLYNIGAAQAISDKFPCLILQDVDLIPLDEANLYACLHEPRHISASIDKFRFVLPYGYLVGGVFAISSKLFEKVNGFSNRFQGWGGEDDDFAARLEANNLNIVRFPQDMSRYTMIVHPQAPRNKERSKIMSENRNVIHKDGYNSVMFRNVGIVVKNNRLFTLIGVKT